MKNSERIFGFHCWLNMSNGYAIIREYDKNGMPMDYWLVRGMFELNPVDNGYFSDGIDYIFSSKHELKVLQKYELLKPNLKIMDVRETLVNLTIPQLESLKPSYYNLAIDARIAELKAMEVSGEKTVEDVTKTKRSRKKSTKTTD